jgi:hypothetical protein
MKKIIDKTSFLAIWLTLGISALTACGSVADKNTNDAVGKASGTNAVNTETNTTNKNAATKPSEAPKAELIEIRDPRKDSEKGATAAEKQLVEAEFRAKETTIKDKLKEIYNDECQAENIGITGTAKGAFTKPNSSQTAFLYEVCSSGSSHFGVGGIMIFENGKIVSHYAYGENGLWNVGMYALPDINKNGMSELVFQEGQTHQGYTGESIGIAEMKDGNFDYFGSTSIHSDDSGAVEDESKVKSEDYQIFVEPGATPVFFSQEKGKKDRKKISLSKDTLGKIHKIT